MLFNCVLLVQLILQIFFFLIGNELTSALKKVNMDTALRLPKHAEQIEKLRKKVTDMRVKQEKQKESVEKKKQQLKKVIRTAAKQLIKYIFPLSIVEPAKR